MGQGRTNNFSWLIFGVVAFVLFDVVSIFAYRFTLLQWALLPVIAVSLLILGIRNLSWALYLPLAELFWGSFGRSLSWQIGQFDVTLRLLMLVIFMVLWAIRWRSHPWNFSIRNWQHLLYLGLLLTVTWGLFNGWNHHYRSVNIFLDANAYFYLVYYPLWSAVFKVDDIRRIVSLLMASATVLSIKTITLFYIFAHDYWLLNPMYLYLWLRDTRIAEITYSGSGWWRIFMQSQIYIGIAWLFHWLRRSPEDSRGGTAAYSWLLPLLMTTALIISFSRSYWLALATTMAVCLVFVYPIVYRNVVGSLRLGRLAVGLLVVAVIAIFALFTIPTIDQVSWDDSLRSRFNLVGADPAAASRIQLLVPLMDAIYREPLFGSGFGATVTYFSQDPRLKIPSNPSGQVTAYAFELGYLDQWLKIGLVGLAFWIVALGGQFVFGWKLRRQLQGREQILVPLLAGLMFVMLTHFFSPYLNHPLGLGYLMLTMVIMQYYYYEESNGKFSQL